MEVVKIKKNEPRKVTLLKNKKKVVPVSSTFCENNCIKMFDYLAF